MSEPEEASSQGPGQSRRYFPDEVAVALCLYGVDLEPAEVTQILGGVEPTHAHRKGDRKSLRNPPFDKGAWIREIRRFEPIDPDARFAELFAVLPRDTAVWQGLASRFQVRVDFAVHTDVGCGFILSPSIVQLLASRCAEFRLDIYAYGDNDA